MSKINYKRKIWKIKAPVNKANKVQVPESIYNRKKQKKRWDVEVYEDI